jgi:hypothetical protein
MKPADVLAALHDIEHKLATRPRAFRSTLRVGKKATEPELRRIEAALPRLLPPLLRALYLEAGSEISLYWKLDPAHAAEVGWDSSSMVWGAFHLHLPSLVEARDENDELVPKYIAFGSNDNGRVFALELDGRGVVDFDHEEPENASRVYATFDAFVKGELARGFVFTDDDPETLERFFRNTPVRRS